MTSMQPTRAAGEDRLRAFTPRTGRRYAARRNHDRGPVAHRDVSGLSPWLRRRLVLEPELVRAALAAHGPEAAGKFVDEVFWRGYFKGWLENRPVTWERYRAGLAADLDALEHDEARARRVAAAESGRTGLDCMDAWATELTRTGYLHNHARMWFASIWIFTLGLPWRVGADFFLRHLLDGDPASNTLGWRWVAGLHTRGKPYLARADNIARLTDGRFAPRAGDLAARVTGLQHEEPEGLPPTVPLRAPCPPVPGAPTALLITEEDCRMEDFDLAGLVIRARATLAASPLRSPRPVARSVVAFEAGALADAAARAGGAADALQAGAPERLADWAQAAGAVQIATGYVPEGPLRDWMRRAMPALEARGITLCEWRRDWDALIWPHATAGFFRLREQIPAIIGRAGLA